MCIWLGTNLPHKTPEAIGRISLEELVRCLDDRLTLSDKELHAEVYIVTQKQKHMPQKN